MEMMRAVLDTNFWLATHVVAVTIGYASTFVAGFLAMIYILRGVFTTHAGRRKRRKSLARMVYGIVCFATLFSFVGTVLGGIWADQSWGRFWGWDPKENGALLIVLWNATILHARWGGMIRERGLMIMADLRQHRHQLVVVRRQHARHRPAQLRLHGRGVQVADGLRRQPACVDLLPWGCCRRECGKAFDLQRVRQVLDLSCFAFNSSVWGQAKDSKPDCSISGGATIHCFPRLSVASRSPKISILTVQAAPFWQFNRTFLQKKTDRTSTWTKQTRSIKN